MHFTFMGMDIYSLLFVMMVYSFMGWFYESTIYSILEQKRLMNRGYFLGPYCPIYSVVSIASLYLLQGVENGLKIVIIGGMTVCVIEYITSYILEKLFDARYWDYSAYPLNINGRVSVISGLFFGLAVLLLVKVVHPFMMEIVHRMHPKTRIIVGLSCFTIFLIDFIVTTVSMCNLNKKCKEIYDYINGYVDDKFEVMTDKGRYLEENLKFEKKTDIIVKLSGMTKKFKENETHFFRAFPSFKSTKYADLVDKIKVVYKKKKMPEIDEKKKTKNKN